MAHAADDAFQKMTAERWRRIEELVHAALDREPAERSAFLTNACARDEELYEELASLISCEGQEHPMFECQSWAAARFFLNTQVCVDSLREEMDDRALSIGTQLDCFRIVRSLGRGGMGEVFLAEDTELERDVALKFLALTFSQREGIEQLTREAKAASALNHPNIVTVYEVIRHQEKPVIVMEFIEGKALRSLCGFPQPLPRFLHIGRQVAEALAAAHAHGIVHSDIKPENIIMRPDGYVKVLDFGLAHPVLVDSLGCSDGQRGGTPRYMSPEQARGEPTTPASDVFSLGLVLYELAAGQPAFSKKSPFGAAYALLMNQPNAAPLKECVPPWLESIILSMLAKDPTVRPLAGEVAEKLNEIFSRVAERNPASSLRWFSLQLTIVAGVLLMLGAVAWILLGWRDAPQFTNLNIHPLTSQGGWESSPALSPDGESIAFTWSEKLDGIREIYVKQLSDAKPAKLTHSQKEGNIGPIVWSPDGNQIAFERWSGATSRIYTIASTGGNETKILDFSGANPSSAIDWSPDGTELAFSQPLPKSTRLAVYLFNIQKGEERKLTSPPIDDWGDWDAKFSPDGSMVAFKRVSNFWMDDIYLIPAKGGVARRLTTERRGIWGHAWVPDGKSLIVSCQRGSTLFGLWRFPVTPHAQPERITQGGVDAIAPATAWKTRRLAWINQIWNLNIYRAPMSGKAAPVRLIASTLRDQDPTYSVEGQIAFISDRSGSREIWLAKPDGTDQVQVTHFNGPYLDHLEWSPDGKHLVFDSRLHGHSDIFFLDCDAEALRCGEPRPLVIDVSAEAPSWSANGTLIYFAVNRDGWNIWKQPVVGGRATHVTQSGGYTSHESSDGRWLYFAKPGIHCVWRGPGSKSTLGERPVAAEELVIGAPYNPQTDGWAITRDQIVFIDPARDGNSSAIRSYDVRTKQLRTILTLPEIFSDRGDERISVSADSRWLLFSQFDKSGSNVIVAENHR